MFGGCTHHLFSPSKPVVCSFGHLVSALAVMPSFLSWAISDSSLMAEDGSNIYTSQPVNSTHLHLGSDFLVIPQSAHSYVKCQSINVEPKGTCLPLAPGRPAIGCGVLPPAVSGVCQQLGFVLPYITWAWFEVSCFGPSV